jgi:CIC family chloride channel protein
LIGAVVGMAALFSATVRAPLTGMIMIVEMTGNYALLLPLMAASLTAYMITERWGQEPIYEILMNLNRHKGLEPQSSMQ